MLAVPFLPLYFNFWLLAFVPRGGAANPLTEASLCADASSMSHSFASQYAVSPATCNSNDFSCADDQAGGVGLLVG